MTNVNQELIAQRLGLSRATVSRSLANHPAISAETRKKVQEMAAKLGYQQTPGRAGRRGKNSRSFTIGVMIGVPAGNVVMATFPYILKGIRDRAEIERVTIDVCYQAPADFHPESSRQPVFRNMRNGDWRGTILIYPFAEKAVELISKRLCTVAGHKRIGFLSWDYPIGGHWVARRFSGYIEALFHHGLPFRPEWIINVEKNVPKLTPSQVADAVAEKIRAEHVTAWVC